MTKKSIEDLPQHLQKYVVKQNYDRYTAEDQAVWRYVMRQLVNFLSQHAHECYLEGFKKTGLEIERIPKISEMHEKLQEFGWGAVPVSGFIPPAAFMEFQARGYLPIASDMRTLDHILYTPAPDIIHEAAGHAPILIDSKFSEYLRSYSEVARQSIISSEDVDLYTAIRDLSDIKENPSSTQEDIDRAEKALEEASAKVSFVSEANQLGRMNWWTAEYGLIGDLKAPKIFGAGLLSSFGEATECLKDKVKKIPLTVECVEQTYDITEPQPQLYVTPDFETLKKVLFELADTMAFRHGGEYGLQRALVAKTINTVELENGLQISGRLGAYELDPKSNEPCFIRFDSPVQLCHERKQLKGHGPEYHSHGYSTPIGAHSGVDSADIGKKIKVQFESGILVEGLYKNDICSSDKVLGICLSDCRVTWGEKVLFEPEWGLFDLALGHKVTTVFGGSSDRPNYEEEADFQPSTVPVKTYSDERRRAHKFFAEIRAVREENKSDQFAGLCKEFFANFSTEWLAGLELLELSFQFNSDIDVTRNLKNHLESMAIDNSNTQRCLRDGILLAGKDVL